MSSVDGPFRLARNLLGVLLRGDDRANAAVRTPDEKGRGAFAFRVGSASLLAALTGALAGLVPAAVEIGVQALLGKPGEATLAKLLLPILPASFNRTPV